MWALDLLLFLTTFILLIILIIDLVKDLFKRKVYHKSHIFKYFGTIISIVVFSVLIVSFFAKEPDLSNPEDRIEYGKTHELYDLCNSGYVQLLSKRPTDIDLNFKYVENLKYIGNQSYNKYLTFSFVRKSKINEDLKSHFNNYIVNGTNHQHDLGYLFLALNELNLQGDRNIVQLDLAEIKDTSIKYFDYVQGVNLIAIDYEGQQTNIEKLLLSSILKNEAIEPSTKLLSRMYFYDQSDLNKIESLMSDDEVVEFVPSYMKRVVYLSSGRYWDYFKHLFNVRIVKSYWVGILFALLISISWIWYLRQVDIFEPEKWSHILTVFGMSCLTIFLVFPYNDLITYGLGYYGGGDSWSEFIREFVKIGLIEEIVKIIPVLVLLKLSKAINEPFDYILYASVSALGFAFIENFGYIDENSLRNINGRLLYAAVGHMLFSSIIGYSMMLAKFHFTFRGKYVVMFAFGLLIAALTHTFYDFWLIDEWASQYKQMTTLLMLVGIHAWFVMKNNALNISNFFSHRLIVQNDNIKFNLLVSFVVVFMGSYVVNSLMFGEDFGWSLFKFDFFNYAFFILYLVFSFTRYETIRGYLSPFKIPYNLLIPRLKKSVIRNQDEVVFYSVKLKNYKVNKSHKFNELAPVNGMIREEILIDGEPDNYIVDIDKDLNYEKYKSRLVIIQANNKNREFNKNGKSLVNIMVAFQNVNLKSKDLTKSDFRFIGLMVMLTDK
jgi:RsiW-degrading membrane proteinase PrsW (M82 family)